MSFAHDPSLYYVAEPRAAARAQSRLSFPPALMLFLAVQAIAWTVVLGLVFQAPHPSALDISLWSRDWYLVNNQHPALAGWLLGAAYFLFGNHLWVIFLASQLCVAGTYLFVFLLGRELLGVERGLLGTLILPVVPFVTAAAVDYDENKAQMLFWAAFCYGLWRASQSGRWPWWLFTATIAALGVYAKFSMLMVIAFGAGWMLLDPTARRCLRSVPLYLAICLFVLLLSPLAAALVETHLGAIKWIGAESSHRGVPATQLALTVGWIVAAMLAIAMIHLAIARRWPVGAARESQSPAARPALTYLALMGGGPLSLTLAIALAMPVRGEWLSPMFSFAGPMLVAMLPVPRRSDHAARFLFGTALAISLGVLTAQSFSSFDNRQVSGHLLRTNWPAAAISQRFDTIWHKKVGAPLRIVGGDDWAAGLAGLDSVDRPSLFPELDLAKWPAGTEARVRRDGVLVLWRPGYDWQPPADLLQRYPHGREMFPRWDNSKAKPIEIDYLVIAPVDWSPTI